MNYYEVRIIHFKDGEPTEVDGEIVAVHAILGLQNSPDHANYEAICLVKVPEKR